MDVFPWLIVAGLACLVCRLQIGVSGRTTTPGASESGAVCHNAGLAPTPGSRRINAGCCRILSNRTLSRSPELCVIRAAVLIRTSPYRRPGTIQPRPASAARVSPWPSAGNSPQTRLESIPDRQSAQVHAQWPDYLTVHTFLRDFRNSTVRPTGFAADIRTLSF